MIRKLQLENWRSYGHVEIVFEPGTTFVVASNGVGKTSLMEAARWALFGTISSNHNAVRAGADSASASVELVLPDERVLFVERTLRRSRRQYPPVSRLDGAVLSEPELLHHLTDAYGTEPGFLARLTMPPTDRALDAPTSLGLEDHLGRYYGVESLRTAIEQLTARQKATETQIRHIKVTNATTAQRLDELQDEVERTELRIEQATAMHRAAQLHADLIRDRAQRHAQVAAWHTKHTAWTEAAEHLASSLAIELARDLPTGDLDAALDELVTEIDRQIETVRVEIAINRTRESTLMANEQGLETAHDDCPVCRRPLDEATISSAHQANAQDLASIQLRLAELGTVEATLLARRQRLRSARDEYRRIPSPGPQPEVPPTDLDSDAIGAEISSAESALTALIEARAAHLQANNELNRAREANNAMAQLQALFREEAVLRAAIETTEATLAELLNDTIRPLANEVNQRWQTLFPDRGSLKTSAAGDVTRTLDGHVLPYNAFSTGEGIGVVILLRLLVAQMATEIDFCWFDEPLEHLDPDVRRKVANILARVTSGNHGLRQLVVTTYEEPLARQLRSRDPHGVRLLDVRQAA